MPDHTPLDLAHLKAEASGAETDRFAFWSRLAETELSLLLEGAPTGDNISPRIFEVEGTRYALAFDTPLRLAGFAGSAPTATLSGRALAQLLAEAGLGLGLNLEDAPSAQLLEPDALVWLTERLAQAPTEATARISEVAPPQGLPDSLLDALDAKLPLAAGMARLAYLAQVRFNEGATNHVLAFVDPAPGAETQIAMAVQEALALSGVEAGALDVLFPAASDPIAAGLARHGLRIDLPDRAPTIQMGLGGDEDEAAPPRLR